MKVTGTMPALPRVLKLVTIIRSHHAAKGCIADASLYVVVAHLRNG
jgi:hypothetical protein